MVKGVYTATLCPAMGLAMAQRGYSQAYCGLGEYGWSYLIASFFVTWIVSDFWEFWYHRLGHTVQMFWNIHRFHHQFYNPSPFAVVSDEWMDQVSPTRFGF